MAIPVSNFDVHTTDHVEFLRKYIAIRGSTAYLDNNCEFLIARLLSTNQEAVVTEFVNEMFKVLTEEVYNKAMYIINKANAK